MKQEEANAILHMMTKVINNTHMVRISIILEEMLTEARLLYVQIQDSTIKNSHRKYLG